MKMTNHYHINNDNNNHIMLLLFKVLSCIISICHLSPPPHTHTQQEALASVLQMENHDQRGLVI